MKNKLRVPAFLEKYRIKRGPFGSEKGSRNGALQKVRLPTTPKRVTIVFSTGEGWEHVSVSHESTVPSWETMECIKRLFWGDHVVVMQLHVAREDWVNNCSTCLHLWRPTLLEIPTPPKRLVGIQHLGTLR